MPRDLPVTEIMTSPAVTLARDASLEQAMETLVAHGITGAPVVDAQGRLVGLLDDTDVIVSEARLHAPTTVELLGAYIPLPGETRRFEQEVRHALARTVEELMHRDPPFVKQGAVLEDVASLMLDRDVSRVPVVDDERRVVGIVSRGDMVTAIAGGA